MCGCSDDVGISFFGGLSTVFDYGFLDWACSFYDSTVVDFEIVALRAQLLFRCSIIGGFRSIGLLFFSFAGDVD